MPNDQPAGPSRLSELLDGAAARDQRAFAELYGASSAKLFGVILRILRDRAQASEVLQEVYLRIWQHAADYRPDKGSPLTWMIAVARHRALDRRRGQRAKLPLADLTLAELAGLEALGADQPSPLDDAVAGARAKALGRCLGELDGRQRQSILLAYAEGCTHAELAGRLDCPPGTVKSLIRGGLLRLRDCLER